MERKLLFKYIEREYWPKAKQALKEAVIYITENDISTETVLQSFHFAGGLSG